METEATCADDRKTFYVFAHERSGVRGTPVLAVYRPTCSGWSARATLRRHDYDYTCRETLETIQEWIAMDFKRPFVTLSREEALLHLTTPSESWVGAHPEPLGYLQRAAPSCATAEQRAARALQHLELC